MTPSLPSLSDLQRATRAQRVETDSDLPARVDAVVIGAGIAGLATARALCGRGRSVAVCEKGLVAAEQSSRAFGWISSLGLHPDKLPLAERSKDLWRAFSAEVGHDRIGYDPCGLIHLCADAGELAAEKAWLEAAGPLAREARLLTSADLATFNVAQAQRMAGGLYQPSDARVEPQLAVPAFAEAARRDGVRIHEACAVRGLVLDRGRITGVVTERGRIDCDAVVVAGGVWSRLFCGSVGVDVPQLPIHSSLIQIGAIEDAPQTCTATGGFAFRRDGSGGFVLGTPGGHRALVTRDSFLLMRQFLPVLRDQWRRMKLSFGRAFLEDWRRPRRWRLDAPSPFERERIVNPAPDLAANLRTRDNLAKHYPAAASAAIIEHWAGIIDATPDSLPIISAAPRVAGLYVNTGYSAYGLTLGLAGGELLADLMVAAQPAVDPEPFRLTRFSDGSPIRPRA